MNFIADEPPESVFKAIINVRGWWTGQISGDADALAGEFAYRYPGFHHVRQKVTEPGTPPWAVVFTAA